MATTGYINLEQLKTLYSKGEIDTVIMAFTDMQGRLIGKRVAARHFLDNIADHGAECCNYLLAVDMEMTTVQGYKSSNWETGYGDYTLKPDLSTLRRIPWLPRLARRSRASTARWRPSRLRRFSSSSVSFIADVCACIAAVSGDHVLDQFLVLLVAGHGEEVAHHQNTERHQRHEPAQAVHGLHQGQHQIGGLGDSGSIEIGGLAVDPDSSTRRWGAGCEQAAAPTSGKRFALPFGCAFSVCAPNRLPLSCCQLTGHLVRRR